MWAQLLPKMVGGTLTDLSAPDVPTKIVGYELTDDWVAVLGAEFNFGAKRQYIGVGGGEGPGHLVLHTTFGESAAVQMPKAEGEQ